MRRQLRLPGFQKKQPGGGEVETGRGKKGKKAGWHLTLGVKDAIFAGIGLVGLLMMSFALGALAGRGDIYRAAYSWGLLAPDGAKVAQWMPAPGPPGGGPRGDAGNRDLDYGGSRGGASSGRGAGALDAGGRKPARPGPVTGSIAPLPPPAAAKKKGKTEDHASRPQVPGRRTATGASGGGPEAQVSE